MKRYYPYSTLFSPRKLRSLLSFGVKGYLAETGWIESYNQRKPVDITGNAIPWFTYAAIDFLAERLKPELTLFEYGSGSSTHYFASRVKQVSSIEHDRNWFDLVSQQLPTNAQIHLVDANIDGDYCRMCLGSRYNVIVIDGRDRNNCCTQAVLSLHENGVILFDDTERPKYKEGIDFLTSKGFKKLTFSGISPGFFHRKETSIFYLSNNCLGI